MSIFNYSQVSDFLRNHIATKPKNGRGELTRLAHAINVSPSLMTLIVQGQRLPTEEQGILLCEYCGFTELETDYFMLVLQRERAGSKTLEKFWSRKLQEAKERSHRMIERIPETATLDELTLARFYSHPVHLAICLFTGLDLKGKNLDEIANRFSLERKEAFEILSFLVSKGICIEENERYLPGHSRTHLPENSSFIAQHHTNWRFQAIQQSRKISRSELMFSGPVSLSREDFELLREEMAQFIQNFLKKVHQSEAEEIACFNLDFFWIKK